MKKIDFKPEEKRALVRKVRDYFDAEIDYPIGEIPAEMLLNFLQEEIGAYYYNKGLHDAQAALRAQMESFDDAIYSLEQRDGR